jgi:diguanylate cyclase (GGDEF)-like protein
METNHKTVRSLTNPLKQPRCRRFFAVVPPELKAQFDQIQLKNSLYGLKISGIITVIFNILNWPICIIRNKNMNLPLFHKSFIADLCQLFITLLFLLFTAYFSKKSKNIILWFICYMYVILLFIILAYSMLSADIFFVLQLFFIGTFAYTFVPDFKPEIFISFLTLWYITFAVYLEYKNPSFVLGGPQAFALNIFLIALLIKVFIYNNKVSEFIETFRINTLNEKLETLSMTDELTKLNNRRSFMEYMNTIWVLSRRLQTPVNVLIIDVDYFKKYNDSLGHLEGDRALVAVAQCMKEEIKREADFVARFGGEEFVCLLPFLEEENALSLAKKLIQKVESMKIPHPMSECSKYVTISAGLASAIPDDHNSQNQLLGEADKALYIAKKSGRNRVVAH